MLVAVVREFDRTAGKAGLQAGDGAARDAVIELEQAADSAQAAADADPNLANPRGRPWTMRTSPSGESR